MLESTPHLASKETQTTDKGRLRANEILGVARQIFATEGYASLSMRRIASKIGISLSAIQHYYPSKKSLVEAMLMHSLDLYQAGMDEILDSMNSASPEEQFAAVLDMFLNDVEDPVTCGMFYELWSLANREKFADEILDTIQNRGQKTVARMLRNLNNKMTKKDSELTATIICAQFQGLMPWLSRDDGNRTVRNAAHTAMMNLAIRH